MIRPFTVASTLAAACAGVALLATATDGRRWWSHVQYLADDKLEGRNTGSAGYRKAAAYVAGEFERAGLKPAGTDGYIQPVRFLTRRLNEAESSLTLLRNGESEELVLGEDAIIGTRVDPAPARGSGSRVCGVCADRSRNAVRRSGGAGAARQDGAVHQRRPREASRGRCARIINSPPSADVFWNAPVSSEPSAFRTRIRWICPGSGSRFPAGRRP